MVTNIVVMYDESSKIKKTHTLFVSAFEKQNSTRLGWWVKGRKNFG
jgi:hypothetical protein